jgi:hypothetical protein
MSDRPVDDRITGTEQGHEGRGAFSVEWQPTAIASISGLNDDRLDAAATTLRVGTRRRLDSVQQLSSTTTGPTSVASPFQPPRMVASCVDLTVLEDPDRLDALRGLNLLDAAPRPHLDRLVRLACDLLDAPIGLLTLVDRARQFFLAAHGLPDRLASARQTSLDYSLCQYVVATGRPLIVGDTRADPLLAANLAVSQMGVVAYAGIPMIDPDGQAFGAFCVLDMAVRDWDDHQLATLARLADMATELCGDGPGWTGFEEAGHVASPR